MKMGRSLASSYYDFSEKLNFYWTSLILLLFVSLVAVLKYVFLESLISCWTPAQFTDQLGKYTHEVCWEQGKVYLPLQYVIPVSNHGGERSTETFHTWIPVVLIFMMLGFQIPRAVKLVFDLFLRNPTTTISDKDNHANNTENAEQLADIIRESQNQSSFIRTLSFIIVKLLVCLNLLIQFIFVSRYFRDSVRKETIETYNERMNKTITVPVYIFPKTILCDFSVRQFQVVQRHTIQCNMPINYLYEQFIHIFWFWLLGVGIFTGLVLVVQLASLIVPPIVRLRFRGIIPVKELNQRNFSVDDSLLMLLDIQNRSGLAMTRKVAAILSQSPQSSANQGPKGYNSQSGFHVGEDALTSMPMTNIGMNAEADTSTSPLMDVSRSEKSGLP
ncbi:innexin unc-7 [Patella vulgata]|uniref:innexin unc-7 n=1 Tax=Patella vulgata TaxID=6465 RepID=UPI00217F6C9C|nr:innexin unc-7 [Patella vulgata]